MARNEDARRAEIRRQYRAWRSLQDLTQQAVEQAAREIYPEFGNGRFWDIEHGRAFPTPSEKKALAKVLKVDEDDLPAERGAVVARAS